MATRGRRMDAVVCFGSRAWGVLEGLGDGRLWCLLSILSFEEQGAAFSVLRGCRYGLFAALSVSCSAWCSVINSTNANTSR